MVSITPGYSSTLKEKATSKALRVSLETGASHGAQKTCVSLQHQGQPRYFSLVRIPLVLPLRSASLPKPQAKLLKAV